MATTFYLPGAGAAPVSPAFDANWEQTGSAVRRAMCFKADRLGDNTVNSNTVTIPITTTQDILCAQYVSVPLKAQIISGTVSFVIRVSQTATTTNATLAFNTWVCSNDGGTSRGVLFSVFGTDTAFPLTASPATRIVNAQAVTPITTQVGDRIVVEMGITATAPSTSNTALERSVNDATTADYGLSSGLTTSLNPYVQFSANLFTGNTPNRGTRPHPFSPGIAR